MKIFQEARTKKKNKYDSQQMLINSNARIGSGEDETDYIQLIIIYHPG